MSVVAAMVWYLDCKFLLGIYDLIHVADQLLILALSNCFLLLLLDFAFRNVSGEHPLDKQVSMIWKRKLFGCFTLSRVSR